MGRHKANYKNSEWRSHSKYMATENMILGPVSPVGEWWTSDWVKDIKDMEISRENYIKDNNAEIKQE